MRKRGIINMQLTKSSSGFTLIQLIVVIVILGILAVTAAPNSLICRSMQKQRLMKD